MRYTDLDEIVRASLVFPNWNQRILKSVQTSLIANLRKKKSKRMISFESQKVSNSQKWKRKIRKIQTKKKIDAIIQYMYIYTR